MDACVIREELDRLAKSARTGQEQAATAGVREVALIWRAKAEALEGVVRWVDMRLDIEGEELAAWFEERESEREEWSA